MNHKRKNILFFSKKKSTDCFSSRIFKISLPEVINEPLSDDDGDDTSEDYERNFWDNTLGYSYVLEEDQANFDAPEIKLEENDSRYDEGLDIISSWVVIVIWILKFQKLI